MNTEKLMEVIGILSRLEMRASSVWVSHLATQSAIQKLAETPWNDPELDRYTNKTRMKEVGGAAMGYTVFVAESLVMALAKSLEDFWIDLKVSAGIKYDIWKSPLHPFYEHEAKVIRSLGNIIKHNQSIIDKSKSEHSKFLVNEAGFPNDIQLSSIFLGQKGLLVPDDITYFMYLYCLDLLHLLVGFKHPVLEMSEPQRRAQIVDNLVPRVLELNAV
jgi:hypothetical protein